MGERTTFRYGLEMVQQFRTLVALTQDLVQLPAPHGGSQSSITQFQGIQSPLLGSADTRHTSGTYIYIQMKHTYKIYFGKLLGCVLVLYEKQENSVLN